MSHTVSPYEPVYCKQCGEILSTDGFCMRCDGTEIEEEAAEVFPQINPEQELDFDKEDAPEYEPDSITTDTGRDSLDDEFARDGTYEMPDVFGGNFN